MRIGPLGALLRHNEDMLAQAAFECSVMTHGTIISGACAFAVAFSGLKLYL